ncbi:hypothetical protein HMPREF2890_06465 [Porphyromonas sp. HMSC065F10]|nr:hypothetical protein HMPREF2890_06465 [Porphyromonas sp. HMSC065F10]
MSMSKNILVIVLKVVCTLVLIYSAFMILFTSFFDLLSLSVYIDFATVLVEKIIPNAFAVIALIFLIRYIWTKGKNE